MPAKNNTTPAKTPIFTRFFTNSRLWYGRVRLRSPLQKIIENSGVLVACKFYAVFLD